jgi:hypothetical protein
MLVLGCIDQLSSAKRWARPSLERIEVVQDIIVAIQPRRFLRIGSEILIKIPPNARKQLVN